MIDWENIGEAIGYAEEALERVREAWADDRQSDPVRFAAVAEALRQLEGEVVGISFAIAPDSGVEG